MNPKFTDEDIAHLYGALRSELNNLPVQDIRNTVAAAGFDVTQIPARSEARSGSGSRAEVMPNVDRLFREMSSKSKVTALRILAERLLGRNTQLAESVQHILGQHGFQFLDSTFVPVDMLDTREARYLLPSSASELAHAMARLVNGEFSGAITAACGAIDLITQFIYRRDSLGNPEQVAFAAKVGTVFKHLNLFCKMRREFEEVGVSPQDASRITENIPKATTHAAEVLQTLRRSLGDVHGSKPATYKTAYDAIKWASAICGLLKDEESVK